MLTIYVSNFLAQRARACLYTHTLHLCRSATWRLRLRQPVGAFGSGLQNLTDFEHRGLGRRPRGTSTDSTDEEGTETLGDGVASACVAPSIFVA